MSTNTGVAPTRAIAPTVAKNVYGLVITSSPGPMFSAIKQANKASVPEETPTACEHPLYCAIACSHCSTFDPKMKCCDSMTSAIADSTSDLIVAYCALRSSSGTCMRNFLFRLLVRLDSRLCDGRLDAWIECIHPAAPSARNCWPTAPTGILRV